MTAIDAAFGRPVDSPEKQPVERNQQHRVVRHRHRSTTARLATLPIANVPLHCIRPELDDTREFAVARDQIPVGPTRAGEAVGFIRPHCSPQSHLVRTFNLQPAGNLVGNGPTHPSSVG
jgi:hypothetical protein